MKSDTGFRLVPKSVILSHGRINGDHSSNASLYEVRGNCNMDKFTDREYAYMKQFLHSLQCGSST